jgi:hypothetical protein
MPHPPIDFTKVVIDPGRLERALTVTVERFEQVDKETGEILEGCYSCSASADSEKEGIMGHWVDLTSADVPRCDCGDHTFRDVLCKHILACLLAESHPVVVAALAELNASLARKLEASLVRA